MRLRKVVSTLVFFSLLLGVGLGHSSAQQQDPNQFPGTMSSETVGSVLPILAGSGSDTIFLLYSTTTGLSSSSPRIIRVQLYNTAGALSATGVVTLNATNQLAIATATGLGATADGIAVLTPSANSAGTADTTGHYGGSAFFADGQIVGTYERSLIMARAPGATWRGFNDQTIGSYIETADFTTRIHIICPGRESTGSSPSALTNRLQALGTLPNTGTGSTQSLGVQVYSISGTLLGVTSKSCTGANLTNSAATSLTTNFTTGAAGLFEVIGSTSASYNNAARGDVIVWRTIRLKGNTPFTFDERLQIAE